MTEASQRPEAPHVNGSGRSRPLPPARARRTIILALGLAVTAGMAGRPVATAPVKQAAVPARVSALEDGARTALRDADADGFIHVRDVKSGEVLVHVTGPATRTEAPLQADSPLAPLSVIKVFVAASWSEHGFGDSLVTC